MRRRPPARSGPVRSPRPTLLAAIAGQIGSRPVVALLAAATALLARPVAARGEERAPTVLLSLAPCPVDRPELLGLAAAVRVELATIGVALEPCPRAEPCEPTEAAAVLAVALPRCDLSEGPALLRVEGGGRAAGERAVPLDDARPEARARTVALAAGELVRGLAPGEPPAAPETPAARGCEPCPAPVEPPPPERVEPLPPPCPAPPSAPRAPGSPRLHVALATAGFPSGGPAQVGLRGGAAVRLARRLPLWIAVDAGLLHGGAEEALGRIDALTATLGLSLAYGVELGPALLLVGPRAELGWTHGFGTTTRSDVTPRAAGGPVALVAAEARAELPLSPRVALTMSLAAGGVVVPVSFLAGGRPLVALSGAALEAGLGVSFDPRRGR